MDIDALMQDKVKVERVTKQIICITSTVIVTATPSGFSCQPHDGEMRLKENLVHCC